MAQTRTSSFKYRSAAAKGDDHYEVTIIVKDLLYSDGKQYMDISYEFKSISEKQSIKQLIMNHPFYGSQIDDFLGYEGEIIAKNSMTAAMVDYLLMEDDKLSEFSGHTTPQEYKRQIMWAITYLWD